MSPDLTMCHDEDCPSAEGCYRFRAVPSKIGQSFFAGSPRTPGAPSCAYYMKLEPGDRTNEGRGDGTAARHYQPSADSGGRGGEGR